MHRRPRWRPIVQTLAVLALYVALGTVAATPSVGPSRFLLWPILGLMLAGCLAAAHDCFHRSLFDSRRANRVAGSLWCAVVMMNFTATKLAHMVHHRYTRVDGDSEHAIEFRGLWGYLSFLASPLAMPRAIVKSLRMTTGPYPPHVVTEAHRRDVRRDRRVIIAWLSLVLVATLLRPMSMLAAYWGPLMFFLPMALAVALPEHYRCDDGPSTLPATRTTVSNPLVRFLIWNSGYHVEHHLYPGVPSCNLPALHRAIRADLRHHCSGYLAFHAAVVRDLLRRGGR